MATLIKTVSNGTGEIEEKEIIFPWNGEHFDHDEALNILGCCEAGRITIQSGEFSGYCAWMPTVMSGDAFPVTGATLICRPEEIRP